MTVKKENQNYFISVASLNERKKKIKYRPILNAERRPKIECK